MKTSKKLISLLLAASLVVSPFAGNEVQAKKKKQNVKVSSVKITNVDKKLRLQKGKKFRLTTSVKVSPNKSKYKKLKFSSSNRKIVLVNSKGLLKGKKTGTAKITAVSKENSKKKATISVIVTNDVLVKSIKLNKTKIAVDEFNEEDIQLEVKKILPSNAKNKEVEWSSSNEDVAEVDEDGVVTTGDVGTATITAAAADKGGAAATCKVVVTENPDDEKEEPEESDEPQIQTAAPQDTTQNQPLPQESEDPQPEESQEPDMSPEPEVSPEPSMTPEPEETLKPSASPEPTLIPSETPGAVETAVPFSGEMYFTDVFSESQSDCGITAVTDSDGTPCTEIHFTKKYQRVFFELPKSIDISEYETISIKANVPQQLALEMWTDSLDQGAESWWTAYATVNLYPFFQGSYSDRLESGDPGDNRDIETMTIDIADYLGVDGASRYLSIGSNSEPRQGYGTENYLIYSVTIRSSKEGIPDITFKSTDKDTVAPSSPEPSEEEILSPDTIRYEIALTEENETKATKDKDVFRTDTVFGEDGSVSYTNVATYNSGMVFAASTDGKRVDLSGYDYIDVDLSGSESVTLMGFNDASSWWNKKEIYQDSENAGRRTLRFKLSSLETAGLDLTKVDGFAIGFAGGTVGETITIYSIEVVKSGSSDIS